MEEVKKRKVKRQNCPIKNAWELLEKKRNYKWLGILEVDTFNQTEIKEIVRK